MKASHRTHAVRELDWCRGMYLTRHLSPNEMHFNFFFGINPPKKLRFLNDN